MRAHRTRAETLRRRNEMLNHARAYALLGPVGMVQAWLDRAVELAPITEMQLWRIKALMGEERFAELKIREDRIIWGELR